MEEVETRKRDTQTQLGVQEKETREASIQLNYAALELENAAVGMKREEQRIDYTVRTLDHEYHKQLQVGNDLNSLVKDNADELATVRRIRDQTAGMLEARRAEYEQQVDECKLMKTRVDQLTQEVAALERQLAAIHGEPSTSAAEQSSSSRSRRMQQQHSSRAAGSKEPACLSCRCGVF